MGRQRDGLTGQLKSIQGQFSLLRLALRFWPRSLKVKTVPEIQASLEFP